MLEFDPFYTLEGLLHQRLHVQRGLHGLHLAQLRAGAGVALGKDGAAVLIGQDRGLKGADFAGELDDLALANFK